MSTPLAPDGARGAAGPAGPLRAVRGAVAPLLRRTGLAAASPSAWSEADLPDCSGRRVVVTGANSGIGYQAARALAARGATVTLACRDAARGEQALQRLQREAPGAAASVAALDLADLGSVRAFAATWTEPLDLLVNNAGVMAIPQRSTADGFETQFGTNHLGHFALTGLLLPALLRAQAPRVVVVSSLAARTGRIERDDLMHRDRYRPWAVYGQSKLANLLFSRELDRRANAAGLALRAVAAHPGYAATNLQHVAPAMTGSSVQARLMSLGNAVLAQPDTAGALPTLFAATAPAAALPVGAFVGPDGLLGMRGRPVLVDPPPQARDAATATWLFTRSEELTGVSFAAGGLPA